MNESDVANILALSVVQIVLDVYHLWRASSLMWTVFPDYERTLLSYERAFPGYSNSDRNNLFENPYDDAKEVYLHILIAHYDGY